ncbi:rhophilin-1 isoform X2 [Triplophysa rosa]|uniref:rhophilin-1 isoform X2 n=1 Tax=Triplophysa rosa TaxID=992332 RepID=UPI002545CD8C|nr:rhophilin-1 isoform X2 [Triplophysa rosa]XP_057209637.1 rhophilin-1 isoform X2 [Triplophysa rosa]
MPMDIFLSLLLKPHQGCDPLVSTQRSKLQQRRAKLNQQINRELLLRTGAENLYRVSSNQKVLETVALELSFVNSNLQLLKEELEELNSTMNVYQTESETVNVPMIPLGLKETKEIDLTVPLQDFISEHYGEDSSLYLNEIHEFMELRQAMRTPTRNDSGQELLMEYYNQLYFLDQRFYSPHRTLGIHFHWYDSLTGVPSVQRALAFEKGSVLFNIGALHTQIGARQDRSTLTGSQNAIDAFQRAAGAFLYLQENFSHAPSLDMSSSALSMLVRLMVAQVQECVCEKVILNVQDNNLNVLLQAAQEAARVSDVYSLVLQAMSVPLLKDYVPFSWISMVQVKTHHFRALAHYYTAVALCDCSGMRYDDEDDEGREIKALIQIHTRCPDKLNLQDPEDKRRLGKAHLRKAIIRHEEALRLHGVCKMLRKMDILQEVLSRAHARSLEKYSDIDQEDDFCEVAEAPEIQSHTQQKPDIKTPDFSALRVTDIFHRLVTHTHTHTLFQRLIVTLQNRVTFISVVQGPLTVFSARSRWQRHHVCLVRGETGLGLTLRGDSPVLVAGVLLGGCAAEAGIREGDYIIAINGVDCRWAEHAEVVHALKSCTERGLELDVITLQTHEIERRTILSSTGDKETQSCGSRKQGRDYERSSWNWSWRSGGVRKRLGSNFNLSFGNFREGESMY